MSLDELAGATVLVTGGTGSFGSTVIRKLLDGSVGQVRVLSRDENKQDALRRSLSDSRVKFYIGDVRDNLSVAEAVSKVDLVFHAAALKQVPSCEFFPEQAVATNIHGSSNVIRSAHEAGVKSVVCLSTDKAVYPINAMGMSKALMEKVAMAFSRNYPDSQTTVSVVRYGNVMYSRGSVIPLFMEQLQSTGVVTVTDPNMTRFMMSLTDSVDLVTHAFTKASPGDLFVRKAPACTVETLVEALARLLGLESPEMRIIGTRHGEKMHESLLSVEEFLRADDQGAYYRVPLDARSLQYEVFFDQGEQRPKSREYTSENTERLDVQGTMDLLLHLPELSHLAPSGS